MGSDLSYTLEVLQAFQKKARSGTDRLKAVFNRLKRKNGAELDAFFHQKHEEVFSRFDCLQCANCCKTISPIVKQDDMDRIAAYLKIPVSKFLQQYLEMDEDGDFVFRQTPCPMLAEDNKCKVYDVRPEACRDYPHTGRKKMKQLLDLTYRNSLTCPAVWKMVDET